MPFTRFHPNVEGVCPFSQLTPRDSRPRSFPVCSGNWHTVGQYANWTVQSPVQSRGQWGMR